MRWGSLWYRWGFWAAVAVGASCGGPGSDRRPGERVTDRTVRFEDTRLQTADVDVAVLGIYLSPRPDGASGARAVLDVAFDNDMAGRFDGTRTQRGTYAAARAGFVLSAFGQRFAPVDVVGPGYFAAEIAVPPERTARVRGRLVYDLPADRLPPELALDVPLRDAVLTWPLRGAIDGVLTPLVVVGVDDRPVPDATVTADGQVVARLLPGGPWLVQPGTELEVRVPDGATLTATVPSGQALTLRAPASGWASVWPTAVDAVASRDVERVADSLVTPEEVVAFVAALPVRPTSGLALSPTGVLRVGAGGPVERAELARTLLSRQGRQAELACGELGPRAALAVSATSPAAPAAWPWAADVLPAGAPPPRRVAYGLVPEWCWTLVAEGDAASPTWRELDLRPAKIAGGLPPFGWRGVPQPGTELWRVGLQLQAFVRGPAGPDGATLVSRDLIRYETDAPTLGDKGFVVDLFGEDDAQGRWLRAMLTIADLRDPAGQLGERVALGDVEAFVLRLTVVDPLGLGSYDVLHPLWERAAGQGPPEALRAAVSAPTPVTEREALAARWLGALGGRSPAPGLDAWMLYHDLLAHRRAAAMDGWVDAEPPLLVTTLQDRPEGRVWRTQTVRPVGVAAVGTGEASAPGGPATAMALPGGAGAWGALGWLGAVNGAAVDPRPVGWAADVTTLLGLSFAEQVDQQRARRAVEAGETVGVDAVGRLWRWDPVAAAVSVEPPWAPFPKRAAEPSSGPTGPEGAHARWTLASQCAVAEAMHGEDEPAIAARCRVATP
ncbi:MAG: hypothetical protein RLZZ383_1656 [Pseudomonadota bacterium]